MQSEKARKAVQLNLYRFETEDHDADWFIVAETEDDANLGSRVLSLIHIIGSILLLGHTVDVSILRQQLFAHFPLISCYVLKLLLELSKVHKGQKLRWLTNRLNENLRRYYSPM